MALKRAPHRRNALAALQGFLGLVEQPHVLDRDNRLVGEGLEQCDLLVRNASRLAPAGGDGADRILVAQ